MARLFISIFCLIAMAPGAIAQNASFFKEHITFKIEDGYFYVSGQYYLRARDNSKELLSLFYPFPTDSIYHPADSLLIYDFNKAREITNYKKMSNGVIFNLDLDSVTIVYISYRQQLKSNTARYILTTTQQWGKPFEEVTYELIIPEKLKITSFSYPPDRKDAIDNSLIYIWRKENFMPTQDMIFTFNISPY